MKQETKKEQASWTNSAFPMKMFLWFLAILSRLGNKDCIVDVRVLISKVDNKIVISLYWMTGKHILGNLSLMIEQNHILVLHICLSLISS